MNRPSPTSRRRHAPPSPASQRAPARSDDHAPPSSPPSPPRSPSDPSRARIPAPDANLTDVLTVTEVAAFLRMKPKGIYSLVAGRKIPFIRVSNRVRFLRSDVVAWLYENRVPSLGEQE